MIPALKEVLVLAALDRAPEHAITEVLIGPIIVKVSVHQPLLMRLRAVIPYRLALMPPKRLPAMDSVPVTQILVKSIVPVALHNLATRV